jgi:prepilin-type N-terminal cleavage/methylation domain-containing protein
MRQHGFTIIELMVGLVISSLCMIMMLMLFKQTTQIGLASSKDAEYSAQTQTAHLVIQKLVQRAGYGSGQSDDIKIATYLRNPAIFWRFIPEVDASPISYQCEGVAEIVDDLGHVKSHSLVLLRKSCGSEQEWQIGDWKETQVIVNIHNQTTSPIFSYDLSESACTPYGIDMHHDSALKKITIYAQREHLDQHLKSTVCLNNIVTSEG